MTPQIVMDLRKSFFDQIKKEMVYDARNNCGKTYNPQFILLLKTFVYNACFEELYLGNAE